MPETSHLRDWAEIADSADWAGLLIGNGASIAVWDDFRYDSLYEVGASTDVEHPLSVDDRALFEAFVTKNFELVLSSLKTARAVNEALQQETALLEERYESVQQALFDAVHQVHVPWDRVGIRTIPKLFKALRSYKYVYSTNYDLLAYWASMEKGGDGFLDFFWTSGSYFDPLNTEVWESRELWTRLFFLHGGIHLRRVQGGGTRKLTSAGGSLLDQFATSADDNESPLLISEGTSDDKLKSILSSDYLSFAHFEFTRHEGGLVVFGHSLSDSDNHLVKPMSNWRRNPVAVALRPSDHDDEIIEAKARIRARLAPLQDVSFFDSTTHPLGSADLVPRRWRRGLR